jgi:hypothetical protein
MLDLGKRLIAAGACYADDTPVDLMREQRAAGVASRHRDRPAAESLAAFEAMQAGTEAGLATCIRFKIDMSAANKTLRDPVAFRCNLAHHWRTGDKYKVRASWIIVARCVFVGFLFWFCCCFLCAGGGGRGPTLRAPGQQLHTKTTKKSSSTWPKAGAVSEAPLVCGRATTTPSSRPGRAPFFKGVCFIG